MSTSLGGGSLTPAQIRWGKLQNAYFGGYAAISLFSMGALFGQGLQCTNPEQPVCMAPTCRQAQLACQGLKGYVAHQSCCYNGTVLPCHIRFWFCVMCWTGMFLNFIERLIKEDVGSLKAKLGTGSGGYYDVVFLWAHIAFNFVDRATLVWSIIILLDVYLSPDWSEYLNTLTGSSVCSFMFNVSFTTQLGFTGIDMILNMCIFVMTIVDDNLKPVPKHKLDLKKYEEMEGL